MLPSSSNLLPMFHRALLTLLLCLLTLPLAGEESGAERRARELEQIRGEIARLQARVEKTRQKARGLEGEIEATDLDLELQEQRLAEATAALALVAFQVENTSRRVVELEGDLAVARDDLQQRLVALYRLGHHGYLRLFLSIDPEESLLGAVRLMRYLAQRDATILEDYLSTRTRFEFERAELEEQRGEKDRWLEQEQARRRKLTLLRRRQAILLAEAKKEQVALTRRAQVLQDKERRLSSLIDLLTQRSGQEMSGKPIQEFEGVLDWPVEGKVTKGFGPIKDPRYKTTVPHNGIELDVASPGPVRAVFAGEVLYSAILEGYGRTVIVRHPGRVFTLYAGLLRLGAQRGDVLSLGDSVGTTDRHLYFEIRVENQPQDPLDWLR